MRLTTRLLLPLLATVAGVMLLFATGAVREREQSTTEEAQSVTAAYATVLGFALEAAFRAGSAEDVQASIDRITRDPAIFGVIVYGPDTRVLFTSQTFGVIQSAPIDAVRRVLATREPNEFTRDIGNERVFSIVRPLLGPKNEILGAMEVVQPWQFVIEEQRQTRQRFILNTLALLGAVTLVIVLLVRGLIAQPLNRFVESVQALGRGELEHRTGEKVSGAELAELAREFNRMADQIEQARADVEREAEERVVLASRLRETEKLAAVGNLAAGLGHEIAAPLQVIRGRAEMLHRRAGDEAAQRNLRIITDQIDRITLIVRNLLDFARRREPRMEQIDAAELLRRVFEFLESEVARADAELILDCNATAFIRADRDLLHQVFINLIMNSLQVMKGREGPRQIMIHVTPADHDGLVTIDVEDTGPGIPADVQHRIFEPFFTTKLPGEGTGLGLAVVKSIVEEHGGTITAETISADGGARFRIRLPGAAHIAESTRVHPHA